jgi:hypothetical protein
MVPAHATKHAMEFSRTPPKVIDPYAPIYGMSPRRENCFGRF